MLVLPACVSVLIQSRVLLEKLQDCGWGDFLLINDAVAHAEPNNVV